MAGHKDAPLMSLNDKLDTTDAYAFVNSNGADRLGAGTGFRFGIDDTDGDDGVPEDISLFDLNTLFVSTSVRSGVEASSTTHGTEAPSPLDLDHEAEPDIANDDILL